MSNPFGDSREFDLAGVSVMLAMPTHRDLSPRTVAAIVQTHALLLERGIPLSIELDHGHSIVHHARSKMVHRFLQGSHNRIFWVDSDMEWNAGEFLRLVALSTVMDMVAGAYPAKQDPLVFMVNLEAGKPIQANEFGCLPFKGLGLGFCVMQRKVVEAVAAKSPRKRFNGIEGPVRHVFSLEDEEVDDDKPARGEDMGFFVKAARLGYQLWVDPTVTLGHIGPHAFSGNLRGALEKLSDGTSVAA